MHQKALLDNKNFKVDVEISKTMKISIELDLTSFLYSPSIFPSSFLDLSDLITRVYIHADNRLQI